MPFQLSGGMCPARRLAAALARDPELLIADEPSTALDVTTQAEIMKLLGRIQRERRMGLILITHDLRLAFSTCERIHVLYAGSLLEVGDAASVERHPFHPYTLGLLLSEPPADVRVTRLVAIRGTLPSAGDVVGICGFADALRLGPADLSRRQAGAWLERCRAGSRHASAGTRSQGEIDALRTAALSAAQITPRPDETRRGAGPHRRALVKTFAGRRGRPVRALKGVSHRVMRRRERRPGRRIGLGQDHAGALPRRAGNADHWRRPISTA